MLLIKELLLCCLAFVIVAQAGAQTEKTTSIILKATGMQYDRVRFHVKPGGKVKITLKNEDDMSHNLVVTQPGARLEVVEAAQKLGEAAAKSNFIPSSDKVLWYIPLLSPGQTAFITFTAPEEPGVYPYVCTFPAHGYVMFGAMYVGDTMPALKEDPNIPPKRRNDHDSTISPMDALRRGHPYPLTPPFLFRNFLPDTGPDAFAVRLPENLSYCWDAGTCRLRYAWQGEFLDYTGFWKSYKMYPIKILGTVFYRDKTSFPLHVDGVNEQVVRFKGYRLINRYPEFHYTIDGLDVYEMIKEKPSGDGLVRTFKIPNANKPVWFTYGAGDGATYTCNKEPITNGKLKLSPEQAREFTIIMTKKKGGKP